MNSSERNTRIALEKMRQELDHLDRLFVEHYKSMKEQEDIKVAPYEGSEAGTLRMEYNMVSEQIHVTLKFDKVNKMYNFRSEKHSPSMDQEAAYHFAMEIAETYEGFRCNAYDNMVIIQQVGSFRDMEEVQAAEMLKKSMEFFESMVSQKLMEFGHLCGLKETEESEENTEPSSCHTEGSAYDTYELPNPTSDAQGGDQNLYSSKMTELLSGYEKEHPKLQPADQEADIDRMEETKKDGQEDPSGMKAYLLSYIRKKGVKKYHSEDESCISARYYEGNLRYFLSYIEQERILEIRVSQKYDKDIRAAVKENPFHSTVDLKHGNVLVLQQILSSCTPEMFEKTIRDMTEEISQFAKSLESPLAEQSAERTETHPGLQKPETIRQFQGALLSDQEDKYQQWEKILKEKEIFLDTQKQEVLSGLKELHQKGVLLSEKETSLARQQEKMNTLSFTLNQKEQQQKEREILLTKKEEALLQKDGVMAKKKQELHQKEAHLQALEEELKKKQEQSQIQQRELQAAEAEFYRQQKTREENQQKMEIRASSLANQIRLLKQQKEDLDEILRAKNLEFYETAAMDLHMKEKYESQIREYYLALKQAKEDMGRLEQENQTLKREDNSSLKESNVQRIQELMEELSEAKEEIACLKMASIPGTPDQKQRQPERQADQFLEYLKEQKGAQPEMLEKRHADDGILVEIQGAVSIVVSFKSGVNFVECTLKKRCNPMLLKKINTYNAQKRKSVIFTTASEILCRTMFLNATIDEIYEMMEENVTALEELA